MPRRISISEYATKVLETSPNNLMGYWPMDDQSTDGLTKDYSRFGNHGYLTSGSVGPTQTGIGDGRSSTFFDGTRSYCNIYSTQLSKLFNASEGTLMAWAKVSGAGVWTDGTARYLVHLKASGSNYVQISRTATNNRIIFQYDAGGTLESVNDDTAKTAGWYQFAITWSVSGDFVRAYTNGSQVGATQTVLGTWSGPIISTGAMIGAFVTTPTAVWSGSCAHVALWTTPLSDAQILSLYSVSYP